MKKSFTGAMSDPDYMDELKWQQDNPIVFIEPTNVCNFSCYFCVNKDSMRPIGYMSDELFYHIADQLGDLNPRKVFLHLNGEPTLHPSFTKFVEYLNKKYKNLSIGVATNSSNFGDNCTHLILDGIVYVATSPDELKRKSNMDFETYKSNIRKYICGWHTNSYKQNFTFYLYYDTNELSDSKRMNAKYEFFRDLLPTQNLYENFNIDESTFYKYTNKNNYSLMFSKMPIQSGGGYIP